MEALWDRKRAAAPPIELDAAVGAAAAEVLRGAIALSGGGFAVVNGEV